jgi:hypothetical protein
MSTVAINVKLIRIDFIDENLETENTEKSFSFLQPLCINEMIREIHPDVQNSDDFNLAMLKPVKN